METNSLLLEKVDFLLKKTIEKKCTKEDLNIITSYLDFHSDNLILGKVFGYSVSEYAYAALKWINSKESLELFNKRFEKLTDERKKSINELIDKEIYKEY